jgi:hypothetical protein
LPGVGAALTSLVSQLTVHVITGDAFGLAATELGGLPRELVITPNEFQAENKLDFITALGARFPSARDQPPIPVG